MIILYQTAATRLHYARDQATRRIRIPEGNRRSNIRSWRTQITLCHRINRDLLMQMARELKWFRPIKDRALLIRRAHHLTDLRP